MISTNAILAFLLASTTTNASPAENVRRRLSAQEPFLFYKPLTTVTDNAAIDLDQQAMEAVLLQGKFALAKKIYEQGGFSQSYAELKLDEPLRTKVFPGTSVKGANEVGSWVTGKVKDTAEVNSTTLLVEYHASPVQELFIHGCFVGANPDPVTEGCFAPTGNLDIDDVGLLQYSYDPLADNRNERTLQSFSTQAKELMWDCQFGSSHSNCPYPTYSKFYQYYGVFDYGNEWIQAAFDKTSTQFSNGNADFSAYSDPGRAEAIRRATIQMNLWMMVIREMEHAIEICQYTKDEDDHIFAWDRAVAYYMGSVAKQAAGMNFEGYSLYTLAEERCMFANTCLEQSSFSSDHVGSIAQVNEDVLKNFNLGQSVLSDGHCEAARTMSRRIVTDMAIPLIQGILRYAYQMDAVDETDTVGHDLEAEGAVFAASILPLLHACNPSDADQLHDLMGVGNGQDVDFRMVKTILEQNYECLEVTCEDIGGIADVNDIGGVYMAGGEPCGYNPPVQDTDQDRATTSPAPISNKNTRTGPKGGPNVGLAVGLVIAIVVVAGLIVAVLVSRKGDRKEFDGPSTEWS